MQDGKAIKLIGAFQDITDRKLVQDALQASEARFHSSFDSAGVGMALCGFDGRWIQVNRRLCEIVGYPEEALLKMTFQDITHPDDVRIREYASQRWHRSVFPDGKALLAPTANPCGSI